MSVGVLAGVMCDCARVCDVFAKKSRAVFISFPQSLKLAKFVLCKVFQTILYAFGRWGEVMEYHGGRGGRRDSRAVYACLAT